MWPSEQNAFNMPDEQECTFFSNEIPTEMMGKDPLDMGQYKKFFGTCRVPKPNVDGLNFNSTSNHIMILYNNNVGTIFYKCL